MKEIVVDVIPIKLLHSLILLLYCLSETNMSHLKLLLRLRLLFAKIEIGMRSIKKKNI